MKSNQIFIQIYLNSPKIVFQYIYDRFYYKYKVLKQFLIFENCYLIELENFDNKKYLNLYSNYNINYSIENKKILYRGKFLCKQEIEKFNLTQKIRKIKLNNIKKNKNKSNFF